MSVVTPSHPAGISSINTSEDDVAGMLGFFESPTAEYHLESSRVVELQPLHPYQREEPLEFLIGSYSDKFVQLSSIALCGFMRIRKNNNGRLEDIANTDDVSFVSMAPLACFKQISVTVQETEVCDLSTHTYPFRCNMDIKCSFSPGVKKQLYGPAFYVEETPGKETVTDKSDTKAGYTIRKAMLPDNTTVPFRTDLHVEMFNTQRLLVCKKTILTLFLYVVNKVFFFFRFLVCKSKSAYYLIAMISHY